ncbi:MAG: phosphoribosyltransferase [Chloroflexales bacterium]|nr:phosphoribosyltransferase [Chloroflexales bacterium]
MLYQFHDRVEAGQLLAAKLNAYAKRPDVVVLGLPRGGVPVAFEVAQSLDAPLDVMLVRKLGLPGQEELAMGAIASGGVLVLNDDVVGALHLPQRLIDNIAEREQQELERRERAYRNNRPAPVLGGKTVILVDDGLATGTTIQAAVIAAQAQGADHIVVAVGTAALESCAALYPLVDEIVSVITPDPFYAVGLWFEDFSPTTDDEVRDLLARAFQSGRDAVSEPIAESREAEDEQAIQAA